LTLDEIIEIVGPALSKQYEAVVEAHKSLDVAEDALRNAMAFPGPGIEDDRSPQQENWDHEQAMRRIEWLDPIIKTTAAALLFSADGLVAEWERSCGIADSAHASRDAAGPLIGRSNLGAVLRASVNNARHFMESGWKADPPTAAAKANIDILEAAGVRGPWSEVVAPRVIAAFGFANFQEFEVALRQVLRDIRGTV
jgi:hypothetical protein